MDNLRGITVAFTGHRDYAGEADYRLRESIMELYKRGYRRFESGMAEGFDLAAAAVVLELKAQLEALELICVVPYKSHSHSIKHSKELYQRVLSEGDEVVVLAESYHQGVFHRRNDYLVDNSSYVVAWYNGRRSGTGYTVKRALKRGLKVENLFSDAQGTLL